MNGDKEEAKDQADGQRKGPFDALSRDDLVRKCKGLLAIAQKAKQSKVDTQEENNRLKEAITTLESQRSVDLKMIDALNEVVQGLTEHKLSTAGKLFELEEKAKHTGTMAIENEALRRQIERLSDENDALMADMRGYEEKLSSVCQAGIENQKHLLAIEEATQSRSALENEVANLKAQIADSAEDDLLKETVASQQEEITKITSIHKRDTEKLKLYKQRVQEISSKLRHLKSARKILLDTVQDYASTIPEWQRRISEISTLMCEKATANDKSSAELEQKIADAEAGKQVAFEKCESLEKRIDELGVQLGESLTEVKRLQIVAHNQNESVDSQPEIEAMQAQRAKSDIEIQNLNKQLEKIHLELAAKCQEMSNTSECMQSRVEALQSEIDGKSGESYSLKTVMDQLNAEHATCKTKNLDLLDEMKEINEVLKERGELISKQQSRIAALDQQARDGGERLGLMEQQCKQMTDKLNATQHELQQAYAELEDNKKRIKQLTDEISSSRDRLGDARSEILSTSTISRTENAARLQEMDDTLEDRYNKLRALAIKLKRKVAQQQVIIAGQEETIDLEKVNVLSKNVQTLQQANDRLVDEIDSKNSQMASLEGKIVEQQQQVETFQKIGSQSSTKDSSQTLQLRFEEEVSILKDALQAKEENLKEKLRMIDNLRGELDTSRMAAKKSNMLSLEIDAYEKSLNEITRKLDHQNAHVKELNQTIDENKHTIQSTKDQLNVLSESLDSERNHSKDLKELLDVNQQKLKNCEADRGELQTSLLQASCKCERLEHEIATNQSTAEAETIAKEKLCNELQTRLDVLAHQIVAADERVLDAEAKAQSRDIELESVRAEYAQYKVRAQSVLRQNQSKETSRESELEETNQTLQVSMATLKTKLEYVMEESTAAKLSCVRANEERCRTENQLIDLQRRLESIKQQNANLLAESKRQSVELQSSLHESRATIEALTAFHKQQSAEIESRHSQELVTLKNSVRNSVEPGGELDIPTTSLMQRDLDLNLMKREDAEGSENVSLVIANQHRFRKSSTPKSRRDLIPLDELLSTTFDSDTVGDEQRADLSTAELQMTRDQLNIQESRVRHMSSLLAEAEQDLAKLTQLNDVLKEEVRRQQRTIERDQHMPNSEYLKNILLKFCTLPSSDERLHLVPVLNTILKLTVDETQQLQKVARGNEGVGGRSWGSYLPIWPNTGTQQ